MWPGKRLQGEVCTGTSLCWYQGAIELIGDLALDKALYLSMPQFPHLQNRTPVDFKGDVTVNRNRMTQSKHSYVSATFVGSSVVSLWLKVVLFFSWWLLLYIVGGKRCLCVVVLMSKMRGRHPRSRLEVNVFIRDKWQWSPIPTKNCRMPQVLLEECFSSLYGHLIQLASS